MRAKLSNNPFEFARISGNIPQATPIVRLHRQVLQGEHSQVDAQAIAQKSIKDPLEKEVTFKNGIPKLNQLT